MAASSAFAAPAATAPASPMTATDAPTRAARRTARMPLCTRIPSQPMLTEHRRSANCCCQSVSLATAPGYGWGWILAAPLGRMSA